MKTTAELKAMEVPTMKAMRNKVAMKAMKVTKAPMKAMKVTKATMKAMKVTTATMKAMKVTTAMKDTLGEDEEKIQAMEEAWQREKAWQLAEIAQMGGDDGGGGGGSERVWREGASVKFRCINCGSICAARNIKNEPTHNQWSCVTCGWPQPPWC